MKNIILVRHAKSSWEYPVSDRDRPLLERSFTDVFNVSTEFIKELLPIDAIFSSPAKRALDTCYIFLETAKISLESIKTSEDLYDFSGNQVIEFIKNSNNSIQTMMVFGHNYAFTAIVNTYGDKYVENIPTGGLVWIEFEIEKWNDLKKGKTLLTLFPKDLRF